MKRKLFRVKTAIFVWQKWVYFPKVSILSFFRCLILLERRPEKNLFCTLLYSIISTCYQEGNITQKKAIKNKIKRLFFLRHIPIRLKRLEKKTTTKHFQQTGLKVKVWVAESYLTLCNPMDCSPPGSSVHGILQARILEWVAISFSRASFQPSYRTCISCDFCILSTFFIPQPSREAQIL